MYSVGMRVVELGIFFREYFNWNVLELEREASGFSIELLMTICL